jgi:hypothetical protein
MSAVRSTVMQRQRRFLFAAAAEAVILLLLAVPLVSTVWAGVVAFWFGCLGVVSLRRRADELPRALTIFHRMCALAFPIGATWIKWHEASIGSTESTGLSNRLQHFTWAFCTVGLFAPVLVRWVMKRTLLECALIVVGFVAALGNLNEVGEWSRHTMAIGRAYDDTIKDLMMNAAGSLTGAIVLARSAGISGSVSAGRLSRLGRAASTPR